MSQILILYWLKITRSQFTNTEVYKTLHDLNPVFMKDIFCLKSHNYHTRKQQLKYPNPRTVTYGLQSFGYRATQCWESLPNDTREASDLKQFKTNVFKHCSNICKCNICKSYVKNLGYTTIKDWNLYFLFLLCLSMLFNIYFYYIHIIIFLYGPSITYVRS